MTADNTPIAKTPARDPPLSRLLVSLAPVCHAAGNCNSYRPNIDKASTTKIAANAPSTQGVCNAVDNKVPERPARTPAIEYAIDMPKTYIADKVNPRNRVTLRPWPAINPARMGIMGRTQGVNDRSKPKPRKLTMTSQKLPLLSIPAIWRSSEGCCIQAGVIWLLPGCAEADGDAVRRTGISRVTGG